MIFDPLGHRRIQTTSLEGQPSPSPFAALPFSFPSLFLYPSHSFIFVRSSLSHPFSLPIFPKSSWRVEESLASFKTRLKTHLFDTVNP